MNAPGRPLCELGFRATKCRPRSSSPPIAGRPRYIGYTQRGRGYSLSLSAGTLSEPVSIQFICVRQHPRLPFLDGDRHITSSRFMCLSADTTPKVMSTARKFCRRGLGRPVIKAGECGEWNRVKGKWQAAPGIDYWYQLDICGQAEGNDGLPAFTSTFEHYYLVRARTHIRITGHIPSLDVGTGVRPGGWFVRPRTGTGKSAQGGRIWQSQVKLLPPRGAYKSAFKGVRVR